MAGEKSCLGNAMRSFLVIALFIPILVFGMNADQILDEGRRLFYESVQNEAKLDSAFMMFEQLKDRHSDYQGRAMTYIGALTALRGRHSSWIYTKYNLVLKGLDIMDEGLRKAPDDIEALFVHGTTCFYMPFLFGRDDDAQRDFKEIIRLLPDNVENYNPVLVKNVLNFLSENVQLSTEQADTLRQLSIRIADK